MGILELLSSTVLTRRVIPTVQKKPARRTGWDILHCGRTGLACCRFHRHRV